MEPTKSFWSKKEGTTGMIALVAAIGFGGYYLAPILITALTNTIHAAILGGVALGSVALAMNGQFRTACSAAFQLAMRKFTNVIVTIDPIGIMKNRLRELKKEREKMNEKMQTLSGNIIKLERKIESDNKDIQQDIKIASAAQEMGKRTEMLLRARKANRRKESTMTLHDLLNKMNNIYETLKKMYEVAEFVISDTEDTIQVKEAEYEAIKAGHSALKSAMSILNGNPDQKALFDQANEALAEDLTQKLGEMKRFLEVSSSFIDGVDIENKVFEEEGLKLIEQWENTGSMKILDYQKPISFDKSTSVSKDMGKTVNAMNTNKKKYSQLLRADYLEIKKGENV